MRNYEKCHNIIISYFYGKLTNELEKNRVNSSTFGN